MWGSIIASVAGSVVSGAMQGDAAEQASGFQDQGTAAGTAELRRQYDLTRKDTAPYRQTGAAANSRLALLLGLPSSVDADAIRERLLPSYTALGVSQGYGVADEANLSAAVQSEVARLTEDASGDPEYGSLLRKFTMADRDADPVYQAGLQFGLDEGTKAVERRARAGGINNSGATLKALARFANDYGTTKTEGSYNRYTMDNTNIYNKLAGVSGAGQAAVGTVTSAGNNMANNIAGMLTSQGNARGAAAIAQGNAMGGAFGGIGSSLQSYSMMSRLFPQSSGGYTGPTGGSEGWGGYGGGFYEMVP